MAGYIIHEGPSALDGSPIVVVALLGKSANPKTGDMVQTYILRQDMHPVDAVKTGADKAVCGNCRLRPSQARPGDPICYVLVWQAPASVWKAYQRGAYARKTPAEVRQMIGDRSTRLGSYGDPAAAPLQVWHDLLTTDYGRPEWTGYSHQWRNLSIQWAEYLMASVDSPAEAAEARSLGWRTFRVASSMSDRLPHEVRCPASAEAGRKTTCDACHLCAGHATRTTKTIVIVDHAVGWKSRVAA